MLHRLERLEEDIIACRVGLLILDSVASVVRKEFDTSLPGNLTHRSNLLGQEAAVLKYLSQEFCIPVRLFTRLWMSEFCQHCTLVVHTVNHKVSLLICLCVLVLNFRSPLYFKHKRAWESPDELGKTLQALSHKACSFSMLSDLGNFRTTLRSSQMHTWSLYSPPASPTYLSWRGKVGLHRNVVFRFLLIKSVTAGRLIQDQVLLCLDSHPLVYKWIHTVGSLKSVFLETYS